MYNVKVKGWLYKFVSWIKYTVTIGKFKYSNCNFGIEMNNTILTYFSK